MDIQKEEPTAADSDTLAVAPPPPELEDGVDKGDRPAPPKIRTGLDADDVAKLRRDPSNEDGKLDVALDESFPTSDPPSVTQPCHSEPAPSSGYDEKAETERERERMKAKE